MTTKKRTYKNRNTGLFYVYLKRLPGYDPTAVEAIKGGVIESYLIGKYGVDHGRRIGLSELTEIEYRC